MADPTPLTSAQVAGAEATAQIAGYWVSGPNKGRITLFAQADVNLADAVTSGLIALEGGKPLT